MQIQPNVTMATVLIRYEVVQCSYTPPFSSNNNNRYLGLLTVAMTTTVVGCTSVLNVQLACRLCSTQHKLGALPYKRGCTVTGESQNISLAG